MRGRRPVPPKLKLLRGNPGKRPVHQPAEPRPGATCPIFLSQDARAVWRDLAPKLLRLGLLTELDRGCFAAFCSAVAEFKWACVEVERVGYTATAINGAPYIHPAVKIKNSAMKEIRAFAAEFGLSPVARGRIVVSPPGDPDDPDDRFFGPRPAPKPQPMKKDPAQFTPKPPKGAA